VLQHAETPGTELERWAGIAPKWEKPLAAEEATRHMTPRLQYTESKGPSMRRYDEAKIRWSKRRERSDHVKTLAAISQSYLYILSSYGTLFTLPKLPVALTLQHHFVPNEDKWSFFVSCTSDPSRSQYEDLRCTLHTSLSSPMHMSTIVDQSKGSVYLGTK
jgi:hypothetical protein